MCGIAMIFHTDGKPVQKQSIVQMRKCLTHRGPDEFGEFISNNLGLAHTRLSIVDINSGAQPMHSSCERYCIIFNGEIYNYLELRENLQNQGANFRTKSDTEVILELYRRYGKGCLKKLRGMFSFAIYDNLKQLLFIGRDRLGIKPLYYYWDNKSLIAASEIKSILASNLVETSLNKNSIQNHFHYQFSICPHTTFNDIYELPPGHFAEVTQDQQLNIKQYWDLEFPEDNEYETDDIKYWQQQFEDALHDAATSHLIGEVPIGAYLSGGLDSSTTAYLLKQHYPKDPQTFSIHFTNPNSDESYAYKPVAEHLGLNNLELTMDDNRESGYFGLLKDCLYHLEQPQRMAVDIPHYLLSDFVRKQNCKVVYTGDGADEILAGYDCFRQDNMRIQGNLQESEEGRKALYFSEYTQYFSEPYMQLLLDLHHQDNQASVMNQYGCYPVWFDMWQVLNERLDNLFIKEDSQKQNPQMPQFMDQIRPKIENRHALNQSLYIETKTRLPGWILWKSDRLSMAHGVEARIPFLDHPLVELTAQLPPYLKLNNMDEKHILKNAVSAHLPEIPGHYKKRGFYTPIKEWFFSEQHADELNFHLSRQKIEETNIFNPDTVQNYINELIQMPAATDMNSYYRTMQLEWVLMLTLSTQMLHQLYIAKEAPCFHDIKDNK